MKKTSAEKVLETLLEGHSVGTDNDTCKRVGTNQMPDVIRRLRKKFDIDSTQIPVIRNGRRVMVSRYWMKASEIKRIKSQMKVAA